MGPRPADGSDIMAGLGLGIASESQAISVHGILMYPIDMTSGG